MQAQESFASGCALARSLRVAATLMLLGVSLILPAPAQAREPDVACAVSIPAERSPRSSQEQAAYRARLHSFATGEGITVAVIDTGVSPHPQLRALRGGSDFVTPEEPDSLRDCDIHGTAVAGVIAGYDIGIAPRAEIVSIRQTSGHYRHRSEDNLSSSGTLETLAAAINSALDERAKVINISVISCVPRKDAHRVDTRDLDAALQRAEDSGAVIVAASGNASSGGCTKEDVVYPAHAATVLAVGALANAHDVAEYSIPIHDKDRRLSADGHVPLALAPGGEWARAKTTGDGQPSPFHGTSFAAPVLSGTVALLAQRYPHESPAQLRARIYAAAEPGNGFIDPLSALTFHQDRESPNASADAAAPEKSVVVRPAAAERSVAPARLMALVASLGGLVVLGATLRRIRDA
ncbi:S8 family serine peptidase [Corynebacterium striatum]|uniref:S8 family serine peptidase n=1 Tax=Corynebacterium striatum TaxID=43770 RepID=UPI000D7526A0|nr:S8 family serine peptidase [Corynebacterium striatum]PXY11554.1 peptidase S8 [Corynebacterium striatum]